MRRRTLPARVPLFQWRVRATGLRFAFYRLDSANPFQSAIYQLTRTVPTNTTPSGTCTDVVGLFDRAQYEYRVAKVIERSDCEVL